MIKKRKARRPISRIKIYLKYGFVITEHEYHCCPRCSHILNVGPNYQPRYCDQCGQKLDFSRVKWEADKELGFSERSGRHYVNHVIEKDWRKKDEQKQDRIC